jgi:hypothetical protein
MARNTSIISSIIFASLLSTGVAAGAQAQAPSTRDLANPAPGRVGNVVGGGSATLSGGGGDDGTITYGVPGAGAGAVVGAQSGRSARLQGDGDGQQVVYLGRAPARAGREAWLSGGGEDAEVVYSGPVPSRRG